MNKGNVIFGASFGDAPAQSEPAAASAATGSNDATIIPGADGLGGLPPSGQPTSTTTLIVGGEPASTEPLVVGTHTVDVATLTSDAIEIVDESNTPIAYQLDAEGNAYDTTGVLRYTAADIATLESQFTIDTIAEQSQYKIQVDGKPKAYANTLEGYKQREIDIAATVAAETRGTVLSKFFAEHPDLQQAYEYKSRTGTIEGFKPAVDYAKITLDQNNVDQLSAIIREGEIRSGKSVEMANAFVEYIAKENKLFDIAKQYHTNLINSDKAATEARQITAQQEALAQQETNTKFLGVVEDANGNIKPIDAPGSLYDTIVNKGVIGEASIPVEGVTFVENGVKKTITRTDIFNTIALANGAEGTTKYQQLLQDANSDPAKMANLAFILLSGGSFKNLVAAKAGTLNVTRRLNAKGASVHVGGNPITPTAHTKLKPGDRVGWQ